MLELLDESGVRATFFVIGRELDIQCAVAFFKKAVSMGHRLANHSMNHFEDFGTFDEDRKQNEILEAHFTIVKAFGVKPVGFRAPGYAYDPSILNTLTGLKYLYDSSTLPGPATLMMAVYMSIKGKSERKKSFAVMRNFFATRKVELLSKSNLWEVPVAVFPIIRMPVHTTFIYQFGTVYGNIGIKLLKRSPGHHVLLFHAIDTLDYPEVECFNQKVLPMRWPVKERKQLIRSILNMVSNQTVVTEEFLGYSVQA